MEDHSGAIESVTGFLLVTATLALLTRIVTKNSAVKACGWDDLVAALSLVCSLAAGIAVCLAAKNGLGVQRTPNDDIDLPEVLRQIYVAEIFHVLSVALNKLSILVFLHILSGRTVKLYWTVLGATIISAWSIGSLLVVCLQCHVPHVWNLVGGQCADMVAFWRSFGALSIAVEIAFLTVEIAMIHGLNMKVGKKLILIACFLARIFDISATSVQLAYTSGFHTDAMSVTLSLWPWLMIAQVVQNVALVTSSVPYLKPFLEAFPSGLYQPDEIRRRGLSIADASMGYAINHASDASIKTYIIRDVVEQSPSNDRVNNMSANGSGIFDAGFGRSTVAAARVPSTQSQRERRPSLMDAIGISTTLTVAQTRS